MARTKAGTLPPFVKLLTLMQNGEIVTKEEIEQKLGKDIHTYRLSTYIWYIKTNTDAIIKVLKNGRYVVGYQITNPEAVKDFLKSFNTQSFVPGSGTITQSNSKFAQRYINSLAALKAKPAKAESSVTEQKVTETTD